MHVCALPYARMRVCAYARIFDHTQSPADLVPSPHGLNVIIGGVVGEIILIFLAKDDTLGFVIGPQAPAEHDMEVAERIALEGALRQGVGCVH